MPDTGHKKLESREHILLRPNMYIGAIDHQTFSDYVDGKLTELKYIPGLVKIINEIIDKNLRKRNNSNNITVSIRNNRITLHNGIEFS